jgi:hypothetical protein
MITHVGVEVHIFLTSALYDELHAPAALAPGNLWIASRTSTRVGLGAVEGRYPLPFSVNRTLIPRPSST